MRRTLIALALAAFTLAPAFAPPAQAYDGLVSKQRFALPAYNFEEGATLPLTVGYETYGTLNAAKDNAVLVCHFFGGSSHAAGKYEVGDERSGYWDTVIGAGAPIDTHRQFVVAVDVPSNLNVTDPHMVTTGPHSLDPKTGKPYGARFPHVSIRDMVGVQRLLMAHLGIERWQAVVGASLGGMQALQWAVDYPERVGRVAAIAAPGRSDAHNQAMCQVMIDAIAGDGNFRGGDYYGHPAPEGGLKSAWKLLYSLGLNRTRMDESPRPFLPALEAQAVKRVSRIDANAWMRLAEASRDFDLARGYGSYTAALQRIQGPVLVIGCEGDALFPPDRLEQDLVKPLAGAGKRVDFRVLKTELGHLGAVFDVKGEADALQAFLMGS